jgi:hypothetical protein
MIFKYKTILLILSGLIGFEYLMVARRAKKKIRINHEAAIGRRLDELCRTAAAASCQ